MIKNSLANKKDILLLSLIAGYSFNESLNVIFNNMSSFSLLSIISFILSLYSINLNYQNKTAIKDYHSLMAAYFLLGLLTNSLFLFIKYSVSIWRKIISLILILLLIIWIVKRSKQTNL